MSAEAPRRGSSDALERLLDGLLGAETAAQVVESGARSLAEMSGASGAAIFLFEEGQATAEGWHPASLSESPRACALRTLAREAMGLPLGTEAGQRLDQEPGLARLPLVFHDRTLGYVLLVPGDLPLESGPAVQRALNAVAAHAGAEAEMAASQGAHVRYQRWFKTLDEQLRVLDRERQKFAAIVHSSDAPVFVTDRSRIIRWTNSVMAERKSEAGGSWIGLACRDACRHFTGGPDDDPCRGCPVSQVLEKNGVIHREYRDTRDGRDRSLYLSALPIRDPSGTPEEVMVTLQDLSDLEILRTSEARYRLLFDRSSRGIAMIDPRSQAILLSNTTTSRMTGHSPEQLHAMTLRDLHAADEWQKLEPLYTAALEGGVLGATDCEIATRDGGSRLAVVTGTRAELDGREVLMLEFRDVTETRRVEEALRQTEARLRRVVAASPIVLFAFDAEGIVTLAEGRGLARLAHENAEITGASVFELYRDYPEALDQVRRALAGEEFSTIIELRGMAFETSFSPLVGPDGENLGVIGVATDVTERRRLSEQLRQAQRMEAIGRLAGGVAHDFNNLLAAMLGHSELMLGRLEAGHPLRRNAEEVQKAASRGAMLTRQLLSFGRKDVIVPRVIDMNAVVTGMEGMLRRLIGEDIQYQSVPAPHETPVRADRGQLEQVILNLVVNARDAMPRGGQLTVEVSEVILDEAYVALHPTARTGRHVVLAVTDTGSGMDAETLSHVFEPFFTTKERGKGTGLGLATVYGIVEQSGGQVLAYSEPGIGSSFKVYLPREESQAADEEPAPVVAAPRGGTETILVVEDEDAVRATAVEALESSGYAVLQARDGVEAMAVADAHPGEIHLLVSDVVMPRMGGGELAQRLSARRPDIRVLFISGYPDDAVVRHGVVERGAPLLQKPFALSDFVRRVRDVLDSPRRQAA
jgi:PAS domain S-box-containing protein